ncbi:MAG: DNA helicase [Gallionellales bacterium RIFCSPHIGHO2_02_FULL_57_16]|nr:MAG: DNA helicase [Gallionellales bacterium RIFCSPHIGHO2_02_FULL_57_16]
MQQPIKVAISDDFLWSFAAIARDRQQAAIEFLSKFRKNPASPGINYEKIQSAADPNMRSVRIDQNYRGIVLKPDTGNVYCLLWIDRHDDAYEWAKTHKVAINPEIGNIQIFSSTHEQPVDVPQPSLGRNDLFAQLKDRELLRLGVPAEALPIVRATSSEDELNDLQKRLPDDAFEALFFFVAGESYDDLIREREAPETVDTGDFAEALNRDTTKRHFVVITDDSDLEALLAAPLASWRVFLHPSQRKLIERDWNGAVRVLGGAGTGKTVVAMHRAVWLARKLKDFPGKPVLFTTFTRTLADDIKTQIAMIASPAERERIEVVNMDQWASALLRRFGYRQELLFDEKKRRDFWARALTRKPDGIEYPDSFYRAEFERVVLPQGCESSEDYMKATRIGRGIQLSRPQRGLMWPVFAEYRSQLRAANFREPEEAYRDALALLKIEGGSLGIHSIVVDETQDLSAAALSLLRAAVEPGVNDLFIVGDAHQRIYRHKVTLSKVGIDIKGRGRRLKINYRTTDEIRLWATARLANCSIDDLDGQPDTLVGYRSLTHGSKPEEISNNSREAERKSILATLDHLDEEGFPQRSICVVVRTNAEATEYANWLGAEGKVALKLDKNTGDDQDSPGIRVATMHRVKGLEFDAVIIAGYRAPEYYANEYAEDNDAGVLVDALTNERCLLHVAATRAKKYLLVSTIVD